MKCAICGEKITWNKSYGYPTFLVCHTCYRKLRKTGSALDVIDEINDIGWKIKEIKEKALTNNPKVL